MFRTRTSKMYTLLIKLASKMYSVPYGISDLHPKCRTYVVFGQAVTQRTCQYCTAVLILPSVVTNSLPWVPEVLRSRQLTILSARGWGRSWAEVGGGRGSAFAQPCPQPLAVTDRVVGCQEQGTSGTQGTNSPLAFPEPSDFSICSAMTLVIGY